MENGVKQLSDLFRTCLFEIPIYQRAYAWGTDDPKNRQCAAYLMDLLEHPGGDRAYFLGAVLLRSLERDIDYARFAIVDGQQRFTTTVIFAAAAIEVLSANPRHKALVKSLSRTFIVCPDSQKRKLRTVVSDDSVFVGMLKNPVCRSPSIQTPSQQRLISARIFFAERFGKMPEQQLLDVVKRLMSAQVLVYSVSDDAGATQIFELANDRGKRLTQLESVKSVLMHRLYLDSISVNEANRDLAIVQNHFAGILRTIEALESVFQAPDEDALLDIHCIAYLTWTDDSWGTAREMAKNQISCISNKQEKVKWILEFSKSLEQSYLALQGILATGRCMESIQCLTVLGLWQGLFPLIIKA